MLRDEGRKGEQACLETGVNRCTCPAVSGLGLVISAEVLMGLLASELYLDSVGLDSGQALGVR